MINKILGLLEKHFYTYAWLRKDGTPYYIGKGCGNRAFRKGGPGSDRVLLLKQNLTEEEAWKHERYMIFIFGRKDLGTGVLRNYTEGGEGCSGMKHSEESKKKIGDAFRGKKLSEEHREKLSKAKLGNTHNKGKTISEEQKRKISETLKGRKHSEERRRNESLAKIGVKHPEERKRNRSMLRWFNNGETMTQARECPEGFQPGMIKRT